MNNFCNFGNLAFVNYNRLLNYYHRVNHGHVETQTMQTADCRLQTVQTVQTVQTECYFFYLYLNFLVRFLL